MEIQTENNLQQALAFLEQGNPVEAQTLISPLFENYLDSQELIYTNRCCTFWIDSLNRLKAVDDSYERCEKLLVEWKTFQNFISREDQTYEPAYYAVQKGFFSSALKNYAKLLEDKDPVLRAEMHRKSGICYKKLGDYENARVFLKEANNIRPDQSAVLAELADCYSLCGDDRIGKVLFREAFFLDPESIDLDFLDSEMIKWLIGKAKEKGYSGKPLLYWVPVFGVLYGIFNITRDLTSQEFGRLRNDIYAMENEIKDPSCNEEILIPKMLNSYFWLIDHYTLTHTSTAKINEILLKIKILDSSIYEMYIK